MASSKSSGGYGATEPSHQEPRRTKCCKIKYKVRYFYSKGAFLVLLWMSLTSAALCTSIDYQLDANFDPRNVWLIVLVVPLLCAIPVIGWLADTKLGNYRVFKLGSSLFFLSTILCAILVVYIRDVQSFALSAAFQGIIITTGYLGGTACLLTTLQLGIDQMPDASSSNITSFIAWFTGSIFLGVWISDFFSKECLYELERISQVDFPIKKLCTLFPVLCMSIVCCSLHLLGPKWLVIEPKSPQSLKTIYRVLKFAAKHKAPLNCSAFTYWEEDIPSRLDLGKSKYGGPFTTEQVEDVKTLLKVLLMFVPIFIITFGGVPIFPFDSAVRSLLLSNNTLNWCQAEAIYNFTLSPWWMGIVVTVVYELAFYPVLGNRQPTTLHRIGIVSFLLVLLKIVNLAVYSTNAFYFVYVQRVPLPGPLFMFLINAVLEFVCSQAPYNMRGQLTGYAIFLVCTSSVALTQTIWIVNQFHLSSINWKDGYIIIFSIGLGLSLIGFLLHCVLARWYKRRVRDEDYSPHRVVEEVYDRYLTQEQSRLRSQINDQ